MLKFLIEHDSHKNIMVIKCITSLFIICYVRIRFLLLIPSIQVYQKKLIGNVKIAVV